MRTLLVALVALSAADCSYACSYYFPANEFTGFTQADGRFDRNAPNPPKLIASSKLTYQAPLVDDDPLYVGGCDDYASFDVTVRPEAGGDVRNYGYYFRVLSTDAPWTSAPSVPVRAEGGPEEAKFSISVADSPLSADRKPIDIEIEVFAVDARHRIGPPTRFKLRATATPAH
jgi:hypothetical protein